MTPEDYRARAEEAKQKHAAALAKGDQVDANFWMEIAQGYTVDAARAETGNWDAPLPTQMPEQALAPSPETPTFKQNDDTPPPPDRLPPAGEVQASPVQSSDAGYYYHDANTGQWLPTTSLDATERKAAGEQIIEPKDQ